MAATESELAAALNGIANKLEALALDHPVRDQGFFATRECLLP
jgi:hypothetical protein